MFVSTMRRFGLGCGLLAMACAVQAADVATHAGAAVSDLDMRAALASVGAQQREQFRVSEISSRNLAVDLLVRRAIADRARAEGLADDAEVARRLRLIEERALYEIYLERAADAAIKPEVVEGLAREEYRAQPERFKRGDSVRVRHILVAMTQDKEAARAKAEALLARLKAGESFEELAMAESSDPGSAQRGGDLGFFDRGRMVKPFEDAAFAMSKAGELSGPIETQFGFHILRFEESRPGGIVPFEEVRDGLMEAARRKLAGDVRRQVQAPLRADGAIEFDAAALRGAVGGTW